MICPWCAWLNNHPEDLRAVDSISHRFGDPEDHYPSCPVQQKINAQRYERALKRIAKVDCGKPWCSPDGKTHKGTCPAAVAQRALRVPK